MSLMTFYRPVSILAEVVGAAIALLTEKVTHKAPTQPREQLQHDSRHDNLANNLADKVKSTASRSSRNDRPG